MNILLMQLSALCTFLRPRFHQAVTEELIPNTRATGILGEDFYVKRGYSDQTKWLAERRSSVEALFTVLNNKQKGLFSVTSCYILLFTALVVKH